ncbi:MAG: hypothetical protein PHF99_09655 [Bacteroidales bacterium]|nr:hypothetical protein [Bacteroidales bacterium]
MKSPFKFLDSYTKEDKAIFFGRDEETEYLYQRVFEQKVLLLYGVSGTGKSSLVYCGLANKFSDSDWLPVSIRRGADINQSFKDAVVKHSLELTKTDVSLFKQVRSLYLDHFKPIHFIFDQFEELFIFGTRDERAEFIKNIKKLAESEIPCRMLFVIREEYLAGITEFEPVFPDIFRNRLRIEKMTRQAAEQVISGPCNVAGINISEGFPKLLLEKLAPDRPDVELTYLQVYLDKLFREYPPTQNRIWDESLLDRMGNVSDLLGQFLDEQIRSLETPEDGLGLLKAFVSVQGTKRQITIQEAVTYSRMLGKDISSEKTEQLIHHFVDLRIMRDRDDQGRYELRHDALAKEIYEQITIAEKELLEVRQFIENAYANYKSRDVILSPDDLDYLSRYEASLYLEDELDSFVKMCRTEIRKRKKVLNRIIIASVFAVFLVLAVIAIYFVRLTKESRSKMLAAYALGNNNAYVQSFYIAKEAYDTYPSKLAEKAVFNTFYNYLERIKESENDSIYNEIIWTQTCNNEIISTDFSKNGNYIYAYLKDSSIIVLQENGQVKLNEKFNEDILLVKITDDEKYVIVVCNSGLTHVFDINGELKYSTKTTYHPNNTIDIIDYSLRHKHLACIEMNKIKIFDLITGELLQTIQEHSDTISSIDISPDERFLVSGSVDGTAKIMYYNSNEEQYSLYSENNNDYLNICSAVFNSNSDYIILSHFCSGDRYKFPYISIANVKFKESEFSFNRYYWMDASYFKVKRVTVESSKDIFKITRFDLNERVITSDLEMRYKEWDVNLGDNDFLMLRDYLTNSNDVSCSEEFVNLFIPNAYCGDFMRDTIISFADISSDGNYYAINLKGEANTLLYSLDKDRLLINIFTFKGLYPAFSPDDKFLICIYENKLVKYPLINSILHYSNL